MEWNVLLILVRFYSFSFLLAAITLATPTSGRAQSSSYANLNSGSDGIHLIGQRAPDAIKSSGAISDISFFQRRNGFELEVEQREFPVTRKRAKGHLPIARRRSPVEYYGEDRSFDMRNDLEIFYDSLERPKYADRQHERVLRFDHRVDGPFSHGTPEDYERVEAIWQARFREWTKRETKHQAARVYVGADSASLPIRILRNFKSLLGGDELINSARVDRDAAYTDQRDDISIHREEYERREKERYLVNSYDNFEPIRAHLEPAKPAKELRFRSKVNALKRQGNFTVENPLFNAGANYDQRARDRVEIKANRRIPLVEVESTFSYGIENKTMAVNLYKRLSADWSCEFQSTHSDHSDVVDEDRVRVNYGFQF